MTTDSFDNLIGNLAQNFGKILETEGFLKNLGIPDNVRVSQKIWDDLKSQVPGTPTPPLPFGVKVELDTQLTGDQWELGPRKPSEAKPSEGDPAGPATDDRKN